VPLREICGQDRALRVLRRAWAAGRLAQAYCFTGPSGVGKRTTAVALAQAVNCLSPVAGPSAGEAPDACGLCRACTRIAVGQHPDVALIAPEEKTVITIDQVRDLAARAALRAYEAPTKVWILDPAHEMQEPAANAFLKTLEEPPAGSLFILVTTAFSALLPTIRSRCQEVRFTALSAEAVQTILERHGRPPAEAATVAALAGGSAERALALNAGEFRATQRRLVEEVWGSLGSLPGLLDRAERLAKDAGGFEAAVEILLSFTRDAAVVRLGPPGVALLPAGWPAEVERIIGSASLAGILRVHAAQRDAQRSLVWHAQPRFAAERMLLQMRDAIEGSEAEA
jgi:DNA polymerase III subunit delta'